MDLSQIAQQALTDAQSLAVAVLVGLVAMAARQLQVRWKLNVSQATQTAIDGEITNAVSMSVGIARARLASGEMNLTHVTTGSPWMDQLAQIAINSLSSAAANSGVTTDAISKRILSGIGHALGDDPTVPTIAPGASPEKTNAAPPPDPAKAAVPALASPTPATA